MTIPGFQTFMLPLLQLAGDGESHRMRDALEHLVVEYEITDAERAEQLPSGTQAVFDNRVSWAGTHLKQAGLLQSTRRGTFEITEAGRILLAENPPRIDVGLLNRYGEYRAFRARRRGNTVAGQSTQTPETVIDQTPEGALAAAYEELRKNLEADLLDQIKAISPAFFERLVVDLLVAMGYGGSRQDAGRAIGGSGDEGIDGVINEDRLGLDVIYIQAKRWQGVVGRPEIQRFAGALQGQRARKGVFITTSNFTQEARAFAQGIDSKIILIDGETLASLMVEHNVGVSRAGVYEVKKIDADYFEGT